MVLSEQRLNTDLSKYDNIDSSLIVSKDFTRNFGIAEDYIEAHVYTVNNVLIHSDYNYKQYKVPGTIQGSAVTTTDKIEFSAGSYLESLGYTLGTYKVDFNILRKKIFNTNQKLFFIKEISADRTEIRIVSNSISNLDVENGTLNFINEIQSAPYYKDFLLNFGDNNLVSSVNIILDKNTDPYSILVKLYKPLPTEFKVKSTLFFVEELSSPVVYQVELFPQIVKDPIPLLKGANFDIDIDENSIKPSDYQNINNLLSNTSISSYQQLINSIKDSSIQINVDYSNFAGFVHFSSAKERLLNFVYKVKLIEQYTSDIATLKNIPNYNLSAASSGSIYTIQNNINALIKNFDGYEYNLYYVSESYAWPKSNSVPPYSLFPSTSSQVENWLGSDDYNSAIYGGQIYSASYYDNENQNRLVGSIPEYIRVDANNSQYELFLDMTGQHFDNIWLYMRSITDLYQNKNNLNKGISKDLVYYALRSLGIKLYNSKSNDNLFEYLIGSSASGSFVPSGSAYNTMVTASAFSTPGQDQQKELLKRIYHNTTYLLKSKGTARGIKALISTFGIPSTILDVTETGGSDKSNQTVEYAFDRFSYALNNSGSSVSTEWGGLYDNLPDDIAADTIEFRFKPSSSAYLYTSSLMETIIDSTSTRSFGISMSPDTIKGYPYSNIYFYINGVNGLVSSSLSLPVFYTGSNGDTDWWNVMIGRTAHTTHSQTGSLQSYNLYVKNKISQRIGHQASASISVSGSYNRSWCNDSQSLYLGGSGLNDSHFIGQFQELRYWAEPLLETTFNHHVLNPESIEGNTSGSAYNKLAARFPLGNNLHVYNHSLTGSVMSVDPSYKTRIFASSSYNQSASFHGFKNTVNYSPNVEEYVANVPNMVYATPVTNKVRIVNNSITGSVLSPFIRLEQPDQPYRTKDTHFIEAAFSPQNEINKDIIAQYGSTINIDELIGDPNNDYDLTYPKLDSLNAEYYAKYSSRYIVSDFIRLIKFFDNSLFKMIKDFVPARANLMTGLVIKSPMLERPKAKRVKGGGEQNYKSYEGEISVGSIEADSSYTSGYGDGSDFYQGTLSGSQINVYSDFLARNTNQYIPYNTQIDTANFVKSDYNPLINTVTSSADSLLFKRINPNQPGVLEATQIQDSYYSNPTYTRPRYDGVKSMSRVYNYYSTDDESYGKNAAIDINTYKFSFSNDINERNFNFFDKTTVNIKYLIDASGSLTELNRKNDNLFEVQTMYRKGDLVNVSLFDKHNPTNQASLDGEKTIFEGGFSFSPIMFRETNENMTFKYITPTETISNKLGVKVINTKSYVFQTVNHQDANFTTIPNGTDIIFLNDGSNTISTTFSLNRKSSSTQWPYPQIPLNTAGPYKSSNGTIFYDSDPKIEGDAGYYTLDWFTPNSTATFDGGYVTGDMIGAMQAHTTGGEYYTYFTAPRDGTFQMNVDIPISVTATNAIAGWSTFKIIGVIEKQSAGSSVWSYAASTTLAATSIPQGIRAAGVDEAHSSILQDDNIYSPFIVKCVLNEHTDVINSRIALNTGDKIRLKVYFAEMRDFFARSGNIIFTINPGNTSTSFFEVFDAINATVTPVTEIILDSSVLSPIFTLDGDNQTLIFNDTASIIYDMTTFQAPNITNPTSISNYYSPVESIFHFDKGDIVRFTSYFTYNPTFYTVLAVTDPVFIYVGSTRVLSSPLKVKLDKPLNAVYITPPSVFAFLKKSPDETTIILNFNKTEGQSSNALIVPKNLYDPIKKNIGNIIGPLKDTVFAKVLVIG